MSLKQNTVFRSVESMAHGMLSLMPYEIILLAVVGGIGFLFHPAFGAILALLSYLLIFAGRRLNFGRREYLKLWLRQFNPQQYRMLDEDIDYTPYASEK